MAGADGPTDALPDQRQTGNDLDQLQSLSNGTVHPAAPEANAASTDQLAGSRPSTWQAVPRCADGSGVATDSATAGRGIFQPLLLQHAAALCLASGCVCRLIR